MKLVIYGNRSTCSACVHLKERMGSTTFMNWVAASKAALVDCDKAAKPGNYKKYRNKVGYTGGSFPRIFCLDDKGRVLGSFVARMRVDALIKKIESYYSDLPVPAAVSTGRCPVCRGRGTVICPTCNGRRHVTCPTCGSRRARCSGCEGKGRVECIVCGGTGKRILNTEGSPAVRRAVVVGMGNVDPRKYYGWDGACPGTLFDARRVADIAIGRGYAVTTLTDAHATRQGVKDAVAEASTGLVAGDKLVLYVSSHGSQHQDFSGDEPDGLDETICLWDGQLIDDLVWEWLKTIPAGVEVDMITDCCHSKSNFRAVPPRVYGKKNHKDARNLPSLVCSFTHYAGCEDGKFSYGSNSGGVFTNGLLYALKDGKTRRAWFADAKAYVKPRSSQVPQMTSLGPSVLDKEALA